MTGKALRLVLALLIPCALLTTTASAAKPDLRPVAAELNGPPYTLIGKRLRISIKDSTKNVGKGRAGPTVTKTFLVHSRTRLPLFARAVPGLGGGKQDTGSAEDPGRDNDSRLGKYGIEICADAKDQEKEENERNNCAKVKGTFYSAYEGYGNGTLSGTGNGASLDDDTIEQWQSTNALLELDQYLGGGFFSYSPSGSVRYTHSGTSNGCTYTGMQTIPIDSTGTVIVNLAAESYSGFMTAVGTYNVIENCGGAMTDLPGPYSPFIMATRLDSEPLPFGSRTLTGSYSEDETNYIWNLRGGSF